MESKLIVYTVLAITLGYVFVSMIPSQLRARAFEAVQPEGESIRGPNPEETSPSTEGTGDTLTDDIAGATDSAKAAADAAKAAEENETTASGLTSYFPVFGTLVVNLTIAFAVYGLAKRRFA